MRKKGRKKEKKGAEIDRMDRNGLTERKIGFNEKEVGKDRQNEREWTVWQSMGEEREGESVE